MRHRLEPLRGVWFALGTFCGWGALASPAPWNWFFPIAFVGAAFVPATRGSRAALAIGGLLQAALSLGLWVPRPVVPDTAGLFRVEIGRPLRTDRWEGRLLDAPLPHLVGSKVRLVSPTARIGDTLEGSGTLRAPRPPGNPGGFDEQRWASSEALAGTLLLESPRSVAGIPDRIESARQTTGTWVRSVLASRLDAPSSALWISTLLADGSRLPPDVASAFRRTGLYHMLSVSGFHLVVLGGAMLSLLSSCRLGLRTSWSAAAAVVWLYVAYLGFPSPALRAAVAFSLVASARVVGRRAHAGNALCLGAATLVLLDPNSLFQTGVQLTLVATAALVWLAPGLESLVAPRELAPWARQAVRAVTTSVAATLATAPVLAWSMGTVPWVGIPAGIVASGFFSAGFLASLAVVVLGPLPPVWSEGFAGAAEACARVVLEIALRVGDWDAGWFDVVRPTLVEMAAWACALGLLSACALGRRARARSLVGLAAVAATMPWWPLASPPPPWASLHVLDVGQGDAVVLRAPDGPTWLVDAGPRSWGPRPRDAGADIVVPALRALRIPRLDVLAITHPDLDHWGGALAVAEAYRPRVLLEPRGARPDPSPSWDSARSRIIAGGTRPDSLGFGQFLPWGRSGAVVVLAPGGAATIPDRNAGSLVLSVRWGRARALLTGDAEDWTERRMLRSGADLRSQVLKLAHHGSRSSTSMEFLAATGAEGAVVSAGRRNRYGHPHAETLDRLARSGARVLDTRQGGWEIRLHPEGRVEEVPAARRWWQGPWERRVLSFRDFPWTWTAR